jgi:hypothetical protein
LKGFIKRSHVRGSAAWNAGVVHFLMRGENVEMTFKKFNIWVLTKMQRILKAVEAS